MAGLAETLTRLGNANLGMDALMRSGRGAPGGARTGAAGELTEQVDFGVNPGNLGMWVHVPHDLAPGAPLVVVLHGCGQTAAGYAGGAGWIELADRFGFVVLAPEQRRRNNAGGCFNWFVPEDVARGTGEVESVREMVAHAVDAWALDKRRVFVTGLSAGGAFANALLATCPDVFAAGAIIAGLPYGGAQDMRGALDMMRQGQRRSEHEWGELVRGASDTPGRWPQVSVWRGLADTTVNPGNGTDLVRQWLDVQGLDYGDGRSDSIGPADHLAWAGRDGAVAVELFTLPRLGHAVPISAADADPAQRCGTAAPFIVETGLSSSFLIAQSWGLAGAMRASSGRAHAEEPGGIAGIIHKALKAAGLTD